MDIFSMSYRRKLLRNEGVNLESFNYNFHFDEEKINILESSIQEDDNFVLIFKDNNGDYDFFGCLKGKNSTKIMEDVELISHVEDLAMPGYKVMVGRKLSDKKFKLSDLNLNSNNPDIIYGVYYDKTLDIFDVNKNYGARINMEKKIGGKRK